MILERLWAIHGGCDYSNIDALCSIELNLVSSIINLLIGVVLPLAVYLLVYDNWRLLTKYRCLLRSRLPSSCMVGAITGSTVVTIVSGCSGRCTRSTIRITKSIIPLRRADFFLDGLPRPILDAFAALLGVARRCSALLGVARRCSALLGVPPVVFIAVSVVKNAFGIWNHASYVGQLGRADHWLATPMIHKVHHANQPQYIDRNYGQVLIVWDRLFGTYAEIGEEPNVGLVKSTYD